MFIHTSVLLRTPCKMKNKKIIIFICVFYYAVCFHVLAKSMKKKKTQTPVFYGLDRRFLPMNADMNSNMGQMVPFPICPYGMQSYGFPYGMNFMGNMGLNSRYMESLTQNPDLRGLMKDKFEDDEESEECDSEEELEVEKPRKTQRIVSELTRACEKIAALCPEVETKNMTESKEKEQLKSLLREFVIKYNAIKNKNCYKNKKNDNFENLDETSDEEEEETCKNDNNKELNEAEIDTKRNLKSRIVFIAKSKNNVTNKH